MKILFYCNQLNLRGSTVAIRDYARYNQEILGNESVICYNRDIPCNVDETNSFEIISSFQKEFEVRTISNDNNYDGVCKDIDLAYFMRHGGPEPLPDITSVAVHAVFQNKNPYGHGKYAFISEWLSNYCSDGKIPWVPYIVQLPEPTQDLRDYFGIPKNKIVIGRLGDYWGFGHQMEWARTAIIDVLNKTDEIVFLMGNCAEWYSHPNIIHVPGFQDLQFKSNFINTCDGMVHARYIGESFGLAISEFLYFNKPVLAWNNGIDLNHINMLQGTGLLYNDQQDMQEKILNIKSFNREYKKIVDKFNPDTVMSQFKSVFLD